MVRSRLLHVWSASLALVSHFALASLVSLVAIGCDQHAGERPRPTPEATKVEPTTTATATTTVIATATATATTTATAPSAAVGPWNPEQIEWHDFEAGMALSRSTLRPVCLVFSAEWCPHCKTYARVFADPSIVAAAKRFVMIRVDVDAYEDLSNRYAPDGSYIPRTVFLDPEGKLADVHSPRASSKYFYDERDPKSLLGGMRAAYELLAVGAPGSF